MVTAHSDLYGAFRLPNALCQRNKTVNPTCHVGKFEVNPTYCVLLKRLVLRYDLITEKKHSVRTLKNTACWRSYPATGIRSLTARLKAESDAEDAPRPPATGNEFHLSVIKDGQTRCPATPIHPKTDLASCLATTPSEHNDTPAQPQTQAMGAARRDPRRGEIPVICANTVPDRRLRLGK